MPYSLHVETDLPLDRAEAAIRVALADEGFGILTEIDVAATLHEKLGIDRPPYRILGACNPTLAHQALESEPDVGVLLPCNVIVYESGDRTVVAAFDPAAMSDITGNDSLRPLADEARVRLSRALAAIG